MQIDSEFKGYLVETINFEITTSAHNRFISLSVIEKLEIGGQFHQHYGVKHKCTGSNSSAPIGAVQFHQQKYVQLYKFAQLENTLYAVGLHKSCL